MRHVFGAYVGNSRAIQIFTAPVSQSTMSSLLERLPDVVNDPLWPYRERVVTRARLQFLPHVDAHPEARDPDEGSPGAASAIASRESPIPPWTPTSSA